MVRIDGKDRTRIKHLHVKNVLQTTSTPKHALPFHRVTSRSLSDPPVTRDNADEKLAHALVSKLILAHRLFVMADGETSARAMFLTRFCRMILGKEDLQKCVNETKPELHARYSDEEIAENTEKGRAVAYLYRVEATELVKEVRRRFMEFDMTMAETLGLDNTDTDF